MMEPDGAELVVIKPLKEFSLVLPDKHFVTAGKIRAQKDNLAASDSQL